MKSKPSITIKSSKLKFEESLEEKRCIVQTNDDDGERIYILHFAGDSFGGVQRQTWFNSKSSI